MKMDELKELQEKTLDTICDLLNQNNMAAIKIKADEKNPVSIVNIRLSHFSDAEIELTGDLHFLPQDNANKEVQYINCTLLIKEEFNLDYYNELAGIISVLNSRMTCGYFTITPDNSLIYRLCLPLITSIASEKLIYNVDSVLMNSLSAAATHTPLLLNAANGKISFTDFINSL